MSDTECRTFLFYFRLFIEPLGDGDKKWRRTCDRGEGAGDDADEHHEREVARRIRTEVDEGDKREHNRERGVDGAVHRLTDRLPYCVFK